MSSSTSEIKVSPAPAVITLAGKVAIVTGASRGIGAGIALRLARDGAKVVVNYNADKKSADAVVAAINSVKADSAIAVQADVSKSVDVDRLFAEAKRVFSRIDIVVANSGVSSPMAPIASVSNEEFDRLIATNVNGVFYTLRSAANLIENNGRIVVIGSGAKTGTTAGMGPYGATKAAIEVLANTLAQELGGRGVTVNSIHPGGVDTDMMQAFVKGKPEVLQWLATLSPMGRVGTVADIGDAVALFVSESARWISGQNVLLTGAGKV